jgi:hypothetical protein
LDPSCLPGPVRDRLAVIGYWACPPVLRDRVDGWDDMDKQDAAAAENDLHLLASALARPVGTCTYRVTVTGHD